MPAGQASASFLRIWRTRARPQITDFKGWRGEPFSSCPLGLVVSDMSVFLLRGPQPGGGSFLPGVWAGLKAGAVPLVPASSHFPLEALSGGCLESPPNQNTLGHMVRSGGGGEGILCRPWFLGVVSRFLARLVSGHHVNSRKPSPQRVTKSTTLSTWRS